MKYFYVYNLEQANFFIKEGVKVERVGKGTKGDFYTKFIRNSLSESVFSKWVSNNK